MAGSIYPAPIVEEAKGDKEAVLSLLSPSSPVDVRLTTVSSLFQRVALQNCELLKRERMSRGHCAGFSAKGQRDTLRS